MGSGKIKDDLAIAFLNVRGDGRVRQVDDHVAFALGSTLEIHAANGLARRRNRALGRRNRDGGSGRPRGRAFATLPDHDKEAVAFDPEVIGAQLVQIDDQPRTVLGLHHRRAAGIAIAQVASLARQLTDHAGKIQGNPGGRFRGVATGRRGWLVEHQLQLDAISRQRGDIQRLEGGRLYHRRQQRYP
ncbi:hypothetical protein D9M73_155100 [compost metagenome]